MKATKTKQAGERTHPLCCYDVNGFCLKFVGNKAEVTGAYDATLFLDPMEAQARLLASGHRDGRVGKWLPDEDFTPEERMQNAAKELFAIVEDYAKEGSCGFEGKCDPRECWHCQAVAMVEKITGKEFTR